MESSAVPFKARDTANQTSQNRSSFREGKVKAGIYLTLYTWERFMDMSFLLNQFFTSYQLLGP